MKTIPLILSTLLFMQCSTTKNVEEIIWSVSDSLPKTITGQVQFGVAGPLVGIHQNHLLIAGGANFPEKMPWEGGIKKYQHTAYIYAIEDHNLQLKDTFCLSNSTAYAANCSHEEGIYTAGGENEMGASSQFQICTWNPEQDRFQVNKLPNLPVPLSNASLVADDNKLYLIGGENADIVSDQIYLFDQKWQEYMRLPNALTHTVALVKDHFLYLFGGRKRQLNAISTLYKTCYKINLKTKEIIQIADLPDPLSAGTGFTDDHGRLILIGGDNGSTFQKVEQLILAIAQETDSDKKEKLIQDKAIVQSNHPGFTKTVLQYDDQLDKWHVASTLPLGSPVTTTAVFHDQQVYIPSGEIKAGIRSAGILTGTIR